MHNLPNMDKLMIERDNYCLNLTLKEKIKQKNMILLSLALLPDNIGNKDKQDNLKDMSVMTEKIGKNSKKNIGEDRDSNNKDEKRKNHAPDQKARNIERGQTLLRVIVVIRKENIDKHRNLLEQK